MGTVLNYSYDDIDKNIVNKIIPYDDRKKSVQNTIYYNESYNIFRLELSIFIKNHKYISSKILEIMDNMELSKEGKKKELRFLLFNIVNKKLSKDYKISSDSIKDDMAFIVSLNDIDLRDYTVPNIRKPCHYNKQKDFHCHTEDKKTKFLMVKEYVIDFVNMVIEEFVSSKIKFMEIMQINENSVNDILNYNSYTYRPNNNIIYEGNIKSFDKLKKEFNIFQKDTKTYISEQYSLIQENKYYKQIVNDHEPLIRAFVNSYYWINNPLYSIYNRNLGYNNEIQNILSAIIEFNMIQYKNNSNYTHDIKSVNDYEIKSFYINKMIKIPIVLYNNFIEIIGIFDNEKLRLSTENKNKYYLKKDYVNIMIDAKLDTNTNQFYSIYVI